MPIVVPIHIKSIELLLAFIQGKLREFLTDKQRSLSQFTREPSEIDSFLGDFFKNRQHLDSIFRKLWRHLRDMIIKRADTVWHSSLADKNWMHWLASTRDILRAIYHKVSIAFLWVIRAPDKIWLALKHFINSCVIYAIDTIKMVLWYTFLTLVTLALIGLTIRMTPYLVSMCKTIIRRRRMRQEEAERQSLLEARRRDLEERAKQARERAKEQEEAGRRQAEEFARRDEEATQRKLAEEREKKARKTHDTRLFFQNWQRDIKYFFDNIGTVENFPEPRIGRCTEFQIYIERGHKEWLLKICEHSLRAFLLTSGFDKEALRQERIRWHPDRLTRNSAQDGMVKKATAMFQMLGNSLSDG